MNKYTEHIDMEAEMRIIEKQEKKIRDWQGDINSDFSKPARYNGRQITITEEATPWDLLGPAQVESVLAFCVDAETEREMGHAEIEERVENRMIRRKNGIPD